jgi:hypothetical protein
MNAIYHSKKGKTQGEFLLPAYTLTEEEKRGETFLLQTYAPS